MGRQVVFFMAENDERCFLEKVIEIGGIIISEDSEGRLSKLCKEKRYVMQSNPKYAVEF